jgi:lipoprotein-anchoring transpeptidase ErfK/SrfK
MTAVALVGVAILAAQAARAAPRVSNATGGQVTKPVAQATVSTSASTSAGHTTTNANALPANSGSGMRVVYSLGGQRVWLVGADGNTIERTFPVVSGTVAAPTGSYSVTRKEPGGNGSDGTAVQYVVIWGQKTVSGQSTTFGFDAVSNVTGLPPKPTSRTGGVRMAQLDAQALFSFVSVGTNVTVVS